MKTLTRSLSNSAFFNEVESHVRGISKQASLADSIISAVPTGFVPAVAMFASAFFSS